MKFCSLSTYDVKGRGENSPGMGRPGLGADLAVMQLRHLRSFSLDSPLTHRRGVRRGSRSACQSPQALASGEHSGCSNGESVSRAVPTFRNSEVPVPPARVAW